MKVNLHLVVCHHACPIHLHLLVFLPGLGCCLLNMSVATTHGKLGFCYFVRLLQPGNVFGLQDVDGELLRLQ